VTSRAIGIALALVAATADAQPSPTPPAPPAAEQAPSATPPAPPAEEQAPLAAPSPPPFETPPVAATEAQVPSATPSCVPGARWYVETSFFVGSIRYRSESTGGAPMTYSGSQTRVALSAASGLLYRACTSGGAPGMHVRLGAYFEAREPLPVGAEAQIDWPSGGGYRLGGRLGASKGIDNWSYTPWELTAGFRARRGILLFGVDGVFSNQDLAFQNDPYGRSTTYGVLVGIGIQARPDAD